MLKNNLIKVIESLRVAVDAADLGAIANGITALEQLTGGKGTRRNDVPGLEPNTGRVAMAEDIARIQSLIYIHEYYHLGSGSASGFPLCCSFWFAMVWSKGCLLMSYDDWLRLTEDEQDEWNRRQQEEQDQGFWRRRYLELCRQVGEGRGFIPCPSCLLDRLAKLREEDIAPPKVNAFCHP